MPARARLPELAEPLLQCPFRRRELFRNSQAQRRVPVAAYFALPAAVRVIVQRQRAECALDRRRIGVSQNPEDRVVIVARVDRVCSGLQRPF